MYSDLNDFLADLDTPQAAGARRRAGQPRSRDRRGHRSRLQVARAAGRRCCSRSRPASTCRSRRNVFGSLERMCLALGVKTLDDLATEIDELMTPQMPAGIMDALKMLPMVGRLRDLMPKTVKDAPCQEVVAARRHARRAADPEVLARGRRPVHHASRWCSRRIPKPAMRNIGTYRMQVFDGRTTGMHWQRHKGGAQHHRVAERLGKRLEVAVALSPEPVLPYCATAPMPEGLDELLLGGFLSRTPDRDGQVRDRRSRGAGQLAHRARRLRRAGRAPPRRAIRRSHRASIRSPTTFRCSTSPASRGASGRPT